VIRVGILGAGFMGEVHAAAWRSVPGVRVAGIATLDPAARPWLRGFDGRVVTDPRVLIAAPDIDVIDVCLPTPLHESSVCDAARAGKAIVCEKPLAATFAAAERIAAAVARARAPFMPAHVVRFFPEYAAARDLVRGGRIGRPATARTFRGGPPPGWAPWILDPAQSGGLFVDLLIHDFDYLRWVLGPVRRVHARAAARPDAGAGAVHGLAVLRFASGAVAHVEGSWAYPAGSPFWTRLELAGPDGLIVQDSRRAAPLVRHRPPDAAEPRYPQAAIDRGPYARMLHHVAERLEHGSAFDPGIDDAVAAVRIASAAAASAAAAAPVEVGA